MSTMKKIQTGKASVQPDDIHIQCNLELGTTLKCVHVTMFPYC